MRPGFRVRLFPCLHLCPGNPVCEIIGNMRIIEKRIGKADAFMKCYLHDDMAALGCNGEYRAKRPAMLVFPGGGYHFCSNREADPVASRFFALGYETFILFYSCNEDIAVSHPEEEGVEALSFIRSLDSVDPDRICGIGFSAGAHALGLVACHGRRYSPDANFAALVMSYPVVTSSEKSHAVSIDNISMHDRSKYGYYSLETQIPDDFPPTFIWSTTDDASVPIENSLLLYDAVRKRNIKVEMHIYSSGRHGLSVATTETGFPDERVSHWFSEAESFIEETLGISQYSL